MNPAFLFYDDYCSMCNVWVRLVIKHSNTIKVLPLHSPEAELILHGILPEYLSVNSVLLFDGNQLYMKSDALIKICSKMNGIWRLFSIFRFVPASFRNFLYDYLAKNRYRWFGKSSCTVLK